MKMTSPKVPKRIRNHVNPLSDMREHSFDGFSNNHPIIVDIGAYRGEFIQRLEEKFRDSKNFIVCEIRKPYAEYLRELFFGKDHVVVFDGDSARNLKSLLKKSQDNGGLAEYIFINFPDPWFKDRHKKRRVITQKFLQETRSWISPETVFVFQTDQEGLFRETQELLEEEGIEYQEFDTPIWDAQTHWELMKISEGDLIYRMKFRFID